MVDDSRLDRQRWIGVLFHVATADGARPATREALDIALYQALGAQQLLDHLSDVRYSLRNVLETAETLAAVIAQGGRIWAAGNGGSMAQASHFCAELSVRLDKATPERPHWPAMPLVGDATAWTALCNDYDPVQAIERLVEAHVASEDALVLFSTSGDSLNLERAMTAAMRMGAVTVCVVGRACCLLAGVDDFPPTWVIPVVPDGDEEYTAAQIQMAHLAVLHILAAAIELCLTSGGGNSGDV